MRPVFHEVDIDAADRIDAIGAGYPCVRLHTGIGVRVPSESLIGFDRNSRSTERSFPHPCQAHSSQVTYHGAVGDHLTLSHPRRLLGAHARR